jgi:acetyl esterase/lipase
MDLLPDAVLRYADHDEAVVDVHLPEHTSGEVVVLVHGGFWRAEWDRTHTRPLARALADDGFVVATPEYRRVGNGGGWPTTAEDVRRALTALPDLLAALEVTPTRTALLGHSAGGHLVLWLANELPVERLVVDRVVALAPVSDLRATAALSLSTGAAQAFMGGGPDEVDYDPADPMVRLAVRPDADVVVIHGEADENVPMGLSRRFVERHRWVRLVELACGHFELIDPQDPAYGVVRDAL